MDAIVRTLCYYGGRHFGVGLIFDESVGPDRTLEAASSKPKVSLVEDPKQSQVCVCISVCVYVCVHECVCLCVCMCNAFIVCENACSVCMCDVFIMHENACVRACTCAYMSVICVCTCTVCEHMCACVCVRAHMHCVCIYVQMWSMLSAHAQS